TADHVGTEAVRKVEASRMQAAETMDPGQLTGVAKNFEHRIDAAAALAEANRAHERRYLHVSEPMDGLVRLDGLLDTEGGAILRTALNAGMLPGKDDDRTPGQRRADALVDLCRRKTGGSATGAGPRPHLVIRASLETLLGTPGASAGELEAGGSVPAETVRRLACDAALTRITGRGELEAEISHASRSIPPSTRRAVEARDRRCVAGSCDRPPQWTDVHHLQHWTQGGPATLPNLVLLVGATIGWSTRRVGVSGAGSMVGWTRAAHQVNRRPRAVCLKTGD